MKAGEPAEVLVRLARVTEHLNKAIALKRRIIEDLRPSALSNVGLTIAVQNLCDDSSTSVGIPVRSSAVEFNLSPEAELAVYRFVQEALANAGEYASATAVDVVLVAGEGYAMAKVRDNGVGFDVDRSRVGHHGLSGNAVPRRIIRGFDVGGRCAGRGHQRARRVPANAGRRDCAHPSQLA